MRHCSLVYVFQFCHLYFSRLKWDFGLSMAYIQKTDRSMDLSDFLWRFHNEIVRKL